METRSTDKVVALANLGRVEDELRAVLRNNMTYSEALEPTIKLAAQLKMLVDKAYLDIQHRGLTVEEMGANGVIRLKPNPSAQQFGGLTKELRNALDMLGLTARSLSSDTQDAFESLASGLESLEVQYRS